MATRLVLLNNFNSYMVRLKVYVARLTVTTIPDFNSYMVRLKASLAHLTRRTVAYFNSYMVRLKGASTWTLRGNIKFQFLYGAIKRKKASNFNPVSGFQFLYGAIKRGDVPSWYGPISNFNSYMVRLKANLRPKIFFWKILSIYFIFI